MDLTYSKRFKKYIKVQNDIGYPQTIYKFPNLIMRVWRMEKKEKCFFDIKNVIGISVDKEDFDVDSLFKA